MRIEENVPLAPFTTFRLGGPGRFFARVQHTQELLAALDFARAKNLHAQILGGGSNALVRDEGYDGLVIKMELAGVERTEGGYIAVAGEQWDALCERAARDGLWGIENLSGIPGTVGGACVQNIGAYGAALSQVIEWVEAYDVQTGETVRFDNAECRFGYRDSIFKQEAGRYVVLRAALQLSAEPSPNLAYKDLAARLAPGATAEGFAGAAPSLAGVREAILAIRAGKFPDLSVEGTAGSFFLNPMVTAAQAESLKERFPDMPLFAMPETDRIKVPLGWLLDHALNLKGLRVGGARLYEKQALVVVASRDARTSDVVSLRDKVKEEVRERIGIDIREEVRILP